MIESEEIDMVVECSYSYEVLQKPNGDIEIVIKAEKRFADLWIAKLSDMTTTQKEIAFYESAEQDTP